MYDFFVVTEPQFKLLLCNKLQWKAKIKIWLIACVSELDIAYVIYVTVANK